ncbi:hypothetical protein [Actinoplanes regularis]|uniref:hypothetical protein n=1 Tax=Actinoplanes regularis TaxID=52697 RepID=UPI0015C6907D|nr:hypothetical protein [Actinoplanes regularis]
MTVAQVPREAFAMNAIIVTRRPAAYGGQDVTVTTFSIEVPSSRALLIRSSAR